MHAEVIYVLFPCLPLIDLYCRVSRVSVRGSTYIRNSLACVEEAITFQQHLLLRLYGIPLDIFMLHFHLFDNRE